LLGIPRQRFGPDDQSDRRSGSRQARSHQASDSAGAENCMS
jgi:hypothetical protein